MRAAVCLPLLAAKSGLNRHPNSRTNKAIFQQLFFALGIVSDQISHWLGNVPWPRSIQRVAIATSDSRLLTNAAQCRPCSCYLYLGNWKVPSRQGGISVIDRGTNQDIPQSTKVKFYMINDTCNIVYTICGYRHMRAQWQQWYQCVLNN